MHIDLATCSDPADPAGLRRLDRLIWLIIGADLGIVALAPLVSDFHVVWTSMVPPAAGCVVLSVVAWFYHRWRPDPRLHSALVGTSQLVAFAAGGAPLSYLAASLALPLQDSLFDAIDHAMGLDWSHLLGWLNARPVMFTMFRVAYLSLTVQMTVAILCLALTGRLLWLRIYMLSFIITALATIAVSAILPAAGVWLHYGLRAGPSDLTPVSQTSWPVFLALRDGSLRFLVAAGAEGIITFPSLHAALAVITVTGLWPIPLLRWLAVAVNVVMLAATPIDGSHYFIDIFAGIATAIICVAAGQKVARALLASPRAGVRAIPRLAPGE